MSNDRAGHNQLFSDKVKIDILMKEYETLRTELLQRINQRFACIGLAGAVLAYGFFKIERNTIASVLIVIIAISIVGVIWFHFGRRIHEIALRILEIEQRINSFLGDELLVWEIRRRNKLFHKIHR